MYCRQKTGTLRDEGMRQIPSYSSAFFALGGEFAAELREDVQV